MQMIKNGSIQSKNQFKSRRFTEEMQNSGNLEEVIPKRTNFSRVLLKTHSKLFNLNQERKKTQEMVTLSK